MISAIILAAGKSARMGQPKLILPWGETTVLGQVIETIQAAGVSDVLVVTGGAKKEVDGIISRYSVRSVHNDDFERGEMLSSIQCGFRNISGGAALICLGDQPQVKERSVRLILEEYQRTRNPLIVPSHNMKRGHPWLVGAELRDEILALKQNESMRDFLNQHKHDIHYVEIESDDVLQDMDTPEDYLKSHP